MYLWLFSNLGEMALLYIFVVSGWNVELNRLLASRLDQGVWLVTCLYILVIGVIHTILFLYPSYFKDYALPKAEGLSTTGFKGWLTDHFKITGLSWTVLTVAGLLILILARADAALWWIPAALIFWLAYILFIQMIPRLIVPLFFKVSPLSDSELSADIRALAERASLPLADVRVFNMSSRSNAANAALTGLGRTRRIFLADTLVNHFSRGEILAVTAHEMGHHARRHMVKIIFLTLLMFGVLLWFGNLLARYYHSTEAIPPLTDASSLPVIALGFTLGGLVLTPPMNWVLRRFEMEADDYALSLTGDPDAFISMMRRISSGNHEDVEAHPIMEILFQSHPHSHVRIQAAERLRQNRDISSSPNT